MINRAVSVLYSCLTAAMASPTSRLLELLELLQTRPVTTGREIADQLEIDARTVRRYIGVLQELGIPVEGQRGVGGGYRIRPGYRLPPLMLADDEAVAVGCSAVARLDAGVRSRRGAREDPPRAAADAPAPGRGARGDARLHARDGVARPPMPPRCSCSADAIRRRRRLRSAYRSFSGERDGARAQPARARRALAGAGTSPRTTTCATTCARSGSTGCGGRALIEGAAAVPPPDGFDAVAHVTRSLASVPWTWEVEVVLDLPVDDSGASASPPRSPRLVDDPAGTLLRMRVDSLDWMATVLAGLGCGFTIRKPKELRASVRTLAKRLAAQI